VTIPLNVRVPPFDPQDVAGLRAWYAPDSLTVSAGKVTAWADKSGNGFNLAQATGAKQPSVATLNGFQGASCAGGTYVVGNAASLFTTAYTIAAALRITTVEAGSYMVSTIGSDFAGGAALLNAAVREVIHANVATGTDAAATTSAESWIATFASSTLSLFVNSVAKTLSTPPTTLIAPGAGGAVSIGAFASGSLGSSVDVFEVLIFNTALSGQDLAALEQYLSVKYGLP
jgi:hypothetical protein